MLLNQFDIRVAAYTVSIGGLSLESPDVTEKLMELRNKSEFFSLCPDRDAEARQVVDQCREIGGTLGGVIEVRVDGVPFGLGTHAQWDLKLDGRLAQAVVAMQAIKGMEIGLGFQTANRFGQDVHDPIAFDARQRNSRTFGFSRPSNNAGGIEAGMTNGEPIVIRAAMKPIATLQAALPSVDLNTMQPTQASYERSDVCAVPAASVVLEAIVALELAKALTEKFGSDHVEEMKAFYQTFCAMARKRFA